MKQKIALFVLINIVFISMLIIILLMIINAYINISELMMLILIFPACVVFIVLGIFLFIFGKSLPLSLPNKLLPFISIPALILSTGFANSSKKLIAGIILDAILIALAIFTIIITLLLYRRRISREVKEA
jgi:hypothetical protein